MSVVDPAVFPDNIHSCIQQVVGEENHTRQKTPGYQKEWAFTLRKKTSCLNILWMPVVLGIVSVNFFGPFNVNKNETWNHIRVYLTMTVI